MPELSHFLISNCQVVTPGREYFAAAVEVKGDKIRAIHEEGATLPDLPVGFDAEGDRLLPGFVDIHTHGANGYDVCDGRPESVRELARAKIREGVTTFLPTTLTIGREELRHAVETVAAYRAKAHFAKAPGLHIEGPFINPKCVGAQNPAFVRDPDWEELRILQEIAPIRLVSLAPEMPGGLELIRTLAKQGIVASIAHSAATWAQFLEAKLAGATHLTHFCNQMTPLHHREIGLVGAGLLDDSIRIEMICDKIHLCPEMIALAFKHVPLGRIMLITDSVAASWLPDGEFALAGLKVRVKEGVVRLENGALAGSTVRYSTALKNVREITGRALSDLIGCCGLNQAQSLGLEGIGAIKPGWEADFLVIDEGFQPRAVFVGGRDRLPEAIAP